MWGYLGGFTTQIPPHTLSTMEIPKDPLFIMAYRQTGVLKYTIEPAEGGAETGIQWLI